MAYCEEIKLYVARHIDQTGQELANNPSGYSFLMSPEAFRQMEKCGDCCGMTSAELQGFIRMATYCLTKFPWAIILYDRIYDLAGHFREIKGDTLDMVYTWYTVEQANADDPLDRKYSVLFIMNKAILLKHGDKSPLFRDAWNLLKNASDDNHWLCIADPLPEPWVKENEAIDLDLLKKQMSENRAYKPL